MPNHETSPTDTTAKLDQLRRYSKPFHVIILHDDNEYDPFYRMLQKIFSNISHHSLKDFESDHHYDKQHLLLYIGEAETLHTLYRQSALNNSEQNGAVFFTQTPQDDATFRFAFYSGVSHVLPIPKDEKTFIDIFKNLLPFLRKRYNKHTAHERHKKIAEHSKMLYTIYERQTPVYLSTGLKKTLKLDSYEAYLNHSFHRSLLSLFKQHNATFQELITLEESVRYLATSTPLKQNEFSVSLVPLEPSFQFQSNPILSRLLFIEHLKDLMVNNQIETQSIPLVIITIGNSDTIIRDQGETLLNEIALKVFDLIRGVCHSNIQIAQWHKNVFTVLPSSQTLEALKDATENIHREAIDTISVAEINPILHSFVVDINSLGLNEAITMIDSLHQKQLFAKYLDNVIHFEINTNDDLQEDSEKTIAYYFEKIMLGKSDIKLLNFFKGLSINTPAQIVKMDLDKIYVRNEKIQAYAMKIEQSVIIQSSVMPFDVMAKVKLVDVAKKISVLSEFIRLKTSANSRQHIRVQSDHRMPVFVKTGSRGFSAQVLDLSIKSMACSVSKQNMDANIGEQVKLSFQLPSQRFEEGMAKVNVDAIITHIIADKESYKMVIALDLEEPYESYLIEYIYQRQQSIIAEVKRIASKL